ncbi:MAG: hypothetical protein R6U98_12065, partial [Pirellulaceae bacterium]
EAEIEVEVPEELKKKLKPSSAQGILEGIVKYDASLKKGMLQDKPFKDVPQFEEIDFTLINPAILEKLDELNLSIEGKTDILRDLMGLTPAEQEVLFDAIFQESEETDSK